LNFLVNLSDSSLPYLDIPLAELEKMNNNQQNDFVETKFSGGSSSFNLYNRLYMTPGIYDGLIFGRKRNFKLKWENKSWLEWNYAEYKAYQELIN